MNIKELFEQADYLINDKSGLTIYPQMYDEDDHYSLEYDDGNLYEIWNPDTLVEPTASGTVLILGGEYRAYVAQQIRFTPEQE